jgi:outer membrane lipoprotein-sorting protein
MRKLALMTQLVLALLLVDFTAAAETPEEKGLAIAQEMDQRDIGWESSISHLKMLLTNSVGRTSLRELRTKSLEVRAKGHGDKSLTIFDRPLDIEGTAFLSHTKITEPDDQWLYLPSLKRVKRISSANKSGPFMGSEFAYEDLLSQETDRYTYQWLKDETCGEFECFVVERYPVYENSGYTRQVVWIDTAEYRLMRIDFYDRKESLLKTLTYSDYRQYLSRYWRAHILQMKNFQNGKGTTLTFEDYQFQADLNENDFTPGRLKRAR